MAWKELLTQIKWFAGKGEILTAKTYADQVSVAEVPDGSDLKADDLSDGLFLRSICSELFDYMGQYGRAAEFVRGAGAICQQVLADQDRVRLLTADQALQMVWVVLQAGMCEYRDGALEDALAMFHLCDQIASSQLVQRESDPHFGVRARVLYCMGLVYREQYDLERSVRSFVASTQLGYQSFHRNEKGRVDNRSQALTYVAIARSIGNGLASVHTKMGRPDLAVPLLMAAKAMLPPNEELLSAHITLIQATLPQWSYVRLHGDIADPGHRMDTDGIGTIAEIRKCRAVFETSGHPLYLSRASYALAKELIHRDLDGIRACRQRSETSEAETLLAELERPASAQRHFRLLAYALRSKLERELGDAEAAEQLAQDGLRVATATRYPAIYLDLLLALGLAQSAQGKHDDAIATFRTGLRFAQNAGNHSLTAMFHLHLSQTLMQNNLASAAREEFQRYQSTKRFLVVETEELRQGEEATRNALASGYTLKFHEGFDAAEEVLKLQRAIVRLALADPSLKGNAALGGKVGLSRQTFGSWLKKTQKLK